MVRKPKKNLDVSGASGQQTSPPPESLGKSMEAVRESLMGDSAFSESLDDDFERLQQMLLTRFSREESSGLYEEALSRAPWLTADVQRLRRQHRQLRQQLLAIRTTAQQASTHSRRSNLRSKFDEFVEAYLEHEAGEQHLLDEMYPGPDWASR